MKNNNQNQRRNSGYENDYGRHNYGYEDDGNTRRDSSDYGRMRQDYDNNWQDSGPYRSSIGNRENDYRTGNYNSDYKSDQDYERDYRNQQGSGMNRASKGSQYNDYGESDDRNRSRGYYGLDDERRNSGDWNSQGRGSSYGNWNMEYRQDDRNDSNKSSGSGSYGHHRGKGPKGYKRSDERIEEEINDRLSDSDDIDATDIEVKVQNGEVILSGTVKDKMSKRRAEDITESISGVGNVENKIKVSKESESAPPTHENKKSNASPDKKEKAHQLN